MFARLRNLDNDAKQIVFVIGAILGLVFVAGLILFAVTGETGLMLVSGVWVGIIVVLAAIGWVAERLFPTKRG